MIDQIIVVGYLVIVLIIGLMSGKNTTTIKDYAVGNRNFSNPVLTAGIAATMIAAGCTSGLVGKIYDDGLICIISYFGVVASRLVVVFLIAPRMEKFLGLISTGDILEKIYGTKAKILVGLFTLIEGPLLAAAQILATYQAGQIFFGLSKETAAILTTMIIIGYCFRGGIRSVTATDVFQFGIMIIAIPIVACMAISKIGGLSTFLNTLNEKKLLSDSLTSGDIPKHLIIFLSFTITCIFPLTIQRMLMAKDVKQIKITFFANSIISTFFYSSIGIIGLAASILLINTDPNFALPSIINEILPVGIRGLVIAGLIAIFMSSSDSDMNISSIALTQDFLKPLLKDKLTDRLAFIITRTSFIFIGIFATAVALYFSNALDIVFLIMVISNSVYFPGLFFGILGFKPSRRSFWIGVGVGATSAAIMYIGLNIFPLYAMMVAIVLNSFVLLASCFKSWLKNGRKLNFSFSLSPTFDFFEFRKISYQISNGNYCDIFAILVIFISIIPFFIQAIYSTKFPPFFNAYNLISSSLALLLLVRQMSHGKVNKIFPVIWQLIIFFSLTLNNVFTISFGQFGFLSIIDTTLVFSLLLLLLGRKAIVINLALFLSLLVIIEISPKEYLSLELDKLQTWLVFFHTTSLIIFLVLFRKRDVDAYKFMTMKLVHETGRTMSSVSSCALALESHMPTLIASYKNNKNTNTPIIDEEDLDLLMSLPRDLIKSSQRTWTNVKNIVDWMENNSNNNKNLSINSIKNSLIQALSDSSFSKDLKQRIIIKNDDDFLFYGDNAQIVHVILNLLENAWHAIQDSPKSNILIWTEQSSLIIKDTGIGIDQKDLPNIFDDFFSTKGTNGQGLSFCKMVMEQHNGEIICESKKGFFTQFKLTFPEVPIHKD